MNNNITFWLAMDEDGEEAIFQYKPEKSVEKSGTVWYEPKLGDDFVELPTGQIKMRGYNLKPGECMEVTGPNYDPSPVNAILEH